jgi:ribosomal protein L11 methyltransferase
MSTQESLVMTYELSIKVPAHKKEAFIGYLLSMGLSGFVEGALDCDIPFEYGPDHLHHDYYVDHDNGENPLMFYAAERGELEATLAKALANLDAIGLKEGEVQVVWKTMSENSWKESWKESFRPLLIAQELAILPPWESPADFPVAVHVVINPGMAFGTGQHETTQLCLQLYLEQTPRVFESVLDVGTGSGILAIAARKFGCQELLGCDIDAASVSIARDNAVANGCPELEFTNDDVSLLPAKSFDLIFANITARPLMSLLRPIAATALPNATLITSGILVTERHEFEAALEDVGFSVTHVLQKNDWIGFVARLRA